MKQVNKSHITSIQQVAERFHTTISQIEHVSTQFGIGKVELVYSDHDLRQLEKIIRKV